MCLHLPIDGQDEGKRRREDIMKWAVTTIYKVGAWSAPESTDTKVFGADAPGYAMQAAEYYLRNIKHHDAKPFWVTCQYADPC